MRRRDGNLQLFIAAQNFRRIRNEVTPCQNIPNLRAPAKIYCLNLTAAAVHNTPIRHLRESSPELR